MNENNQAELTCALAARLTKRLEILTDKDSGILATAFNLACKSNALITHILLKKTAKAYGLEEGSNQGKLLREIAKIAANNDLSSEANQINHFLSSVEKFGVYAQEHLYKDGDGAIKQVIANFKAPKLC